MSCKSGTWQANNGSAKRRKRHPKPCILSKHVLPKSAVSDYCGNLIGCPQFS